MIDPPSRAAARAPSQTLEAFAQVIRALAPEAVSVSFHDRLAETLWLSEDFLLPEDHQLVEESLEDRAVRGVLYAAREEGRYAVALPVLDAEGDVNGAVLLTVDSGNTDERVGEPLELRLSPVLVCLAAEFVRRMAGARAPSVDAHAAAQMEQALQAERFELFLQPIFSLHDDANRARYEVLLRLRTQGGVLLEPRAFLRTAADRHLMPAIDRWVVRTLLCWLRDHRAVWMQRHASFAVNLAAQSMTDANFVSYVESCVIKSGLPPGALCFEVTERFAASGNISVAESMKRIEALGCEVALDDFGANAPSYGYLRSVPVHYFKIDGSLVVAAPTDRVARAVISSIVKMAGDLGVRTVAESVESDLELQAVRSLGVDFAQGFLMARPQSLAGFDFERPSTH